MGSNQYPSIGWMRGAVKGGYNIKYPFHVSEYAHSMGNACGNLVDYWEAIESTNFFCGGGYLGLGRPSHVQLRQENRRTLPSVWR